MTLPVIFHDLAEVGLNEAAAYDARARRGAPLMARGHNRMGLGPPARPHPVMAHPAAIVLAAPVSIRP